MSGPGTVSQHVGHLKVGINSDLAYMLARNGPSYRKRHSMIFHEKVVKTRYVEETFWESVPLPEYWPLHTRRNHKTVKDVMYVLRHDPYNLALDHSRFDEEDTTTSEDKATGLSERMAHRFLQLPDRFYTDYITGTRTTLPRFENAFDGSPLFSTTDGNGSARFGVTNGNYQPYSAPSSEADVWKEVIFRAQRFFNSFKDTVGDPYFDEQENRDFTRYLITVPIHLAEYFYKAAEIQFGAFNSSINSGSDNPGISMGKFAILVDQRLPDTFNNVTVQLVSDEAALKPLVKVVRTDLEHLVQDESNNDLAQEAGIRSRLAHVRMGMQPWNPRSIIQFNAA